MLKDIDIIRISKGPQFNLKGGHILAMILITCLILTVTSLFIAEFLLSAFLLIISILLFNFILDIRGIEIDTKKQIIRDYRQILWFRIAKSRKLDYFKTISLNQKNIIIGTSEYSDHPYDTYHYYHVKLVDETNNIEILIKEFNNYYKARNFALKIAESLKLVFKDYLSKQVF